jgi:hypothetical protein
MTVCEAVTNVGTPKVWELLGCSAPPPEKTDFVDRMISKVLRDLPFSITQSLESPGDWYIGILKNMKAVNMLIFSV